MPDSKAHYRLGDRTSAVKRRLQRENQKPRGRDSSEFWTGEARLCLVETGESFSQDRTSLLQYERSSIRPEGVARLAAWQGGRGPRGCGAVSGIHWRRFLNRSAALGHTQDHLFTAVDHRGWRWLHPFPSPFLRFDASGFPCPCTVDRQGLHHLRQSEIPRLWLDRLVSAQEQEGVVPAS